MTINSNYNSTLTDEFENKEAEKEYKLSRDAWMRNGEHAVHGSLTFNDMMAVPNASHWLPKVIEEVVREPVEPMLIIPSILETISYQAGPQIQFPAIGALVAYDLAEGMAYPEQTLNIAPGTMVTTIGKSGLAFKISEEMRRYSRFDIINLHLRAARRALERHKEKKGMNFISSMGVTLFDNKSPTTSIYGTCTGRGLDGNPNGSCTMDDLLKAYAFVMMQGFTPDTILIHPLTWSMWMSDPLLQTILKNTGNGSWFQPHNMPMSERPWDAASLGGLGQSSSRQFTPGGNAASATPTSVADIDQNLTSAPRIPSYFPHPLTVLVSPFVPFDEDAQTADIMLFDRQNLGALIVDEPIVMDEWEDKSVDLMKVKLRERYTFGIYHDGNGIAVLRNIPIVANEISLPLQATIAASGTISPIDPTVAISGL